jgi:hypothetical protein
MRNHKFYFVLIFAMAFLIILICVQYSKIIALEKNIGEVHLNNIRYVKAHVRSEKKALINSSYMKEEDISRNQWRFNEFIQLRLPGGLFDYYFASIRDDYRLLSEAPEAGRNKDDIEISKQRIIDKLSIVESALGLIEEYCGEDPIKYYGLTKDSEIMDIVNSRIQAHINEY